MAGGDGARRANAEQGERESGRESEREREVLREKGEEGEAADSDVHPP